MVNEALPSSYAPAGKRARPSAVRQSWRQNWVLYFLLIPAAALLLLLRLYPLWGISIAFVKFNPVAGISGSTWVGLKNFQEVFLHSGILNLVRNTLVLSLGKLLLGEMAGLAFALVLYHVQFPPYKRLVQTVSTFPHFFSWVIVGALALNLLGSSGSVNHLLAAVGIPAVRFLGDKNVFPYTLILSDVWKEFGWSAVIYLAALTQINMELIEAAAVDGAGRGSRLWHIILPCILPTMIFMIALGLGNILEAGMDQVLVLYNPAVYSTGDILDTYVYRMGLVNLKFEIATVVGIIKAVVGYLAIVGANWASGKLANIRMF
jgi:putative aldouronate transport system permease protein